MTAYLRTRAIITIVRISIELCSSALSIQRNISPPRAFPT